jgi:transcriptional regulator with XRE-family HTH domain
MTHERENGGHTDRKPRGLDQARADELLAIAPADMLPWLSTWLLKIAPADMIPWLRARLRDQRAEVAPRRSGGRLEKPPAKLWDDPRLADALQFHEIRDLYRHLQARGYSQRQIAALTGQSQSEISEVLGRGRRINSYDVLVRIAEGLGIPRSRMGLGFGDSGPGTCACSPPAEPDHPENQRAVNRPEETGSGSGPGGV